MPDPIDDYLAGLIAEGFGSATGEDDAAWLRRRLKEAGYAIVDEQEIENLLAIIATRNEALERYENGQMGL